MDFYKSKISDIEKTLKTNISEGLSLNEVLKRQKRDGFNIIVRGKRKNIFQMFLEQISDFMVLTLIGAAIISFVLGEKNEALLIFIIVFINALLGIIQENKAENSLEAIKKLSSPHVAVIREGKFMTIKAEELVIGDIVVIEAGDYVPADIRLFENNSLKIDESPLTGESIPVEKSLKINDKDNVSLGELLNCAFMGTSVTYGRGKGIVYATGMKAEIGKIATMISDVEGVQTPLQKNLDKLGKILLIGILFVCLIIFLIGISQKLKIFDMFINVVSLAVAAIPEGLPAIVTIVLAIGMQRMVKNNAIIRKLPAVETLGATNIICTDKTGTLTLNKMQIRTVFINNKYHNVDTDNLDEMLKKLIIYGVLCNNTKLSQHLDSIIKSGDPTEIALVDLALKYNINPNKIIEENKRIFEIPFISERKMMTTVNSIDNKKIVITKGALEEVLKRCNNIYINNTVYPLLQDHIDKINEANSNLTNKALRVIALSYKVYSDDTIKESNLEKGLTFVGLIGMIDPPRPEVHEAIKKCKQAGIQTIMITGDHKNTAIAIAQTIGILDSDSEAITGVELDGLSDKDLSRNINNFRVYARVSPEHKVRIVKAWKEQNKIVAMTGDGVNDAPALKNADIGIAMGLSGTEVAKEASDMILTDDNFATIVKAVEEGRTIFTNVKKSIKFLLSCNFGEIITILFGTLLGSLLYSITVTPLSAVQLLWGNLVTDSLIAIAIGLEKAEPDIMNKEAEKHTLLDFHSAIMILFIGLLIGCLSFTAFHIGYRMGVDQKNSIILGQTMAFMTLTISQLFHAFNIRSEHHSILKIGIFTNKYIIFAFVVSMILQFSTILFPFMRELFNTVLLTPKQLMIVLLLSFLPILVIEFGKTFYRSEG